MPGYFRDYNEGNGGADQTVICEPTYHQVEITKDHDTNNGQDEDNVHRYCNPNPNFSNQVKNYYVVATDSLTNWNNQNEQEQDFPYNSYLASTDRNPD